MNPAAAPWLRRQALLTLVAMPALPLAAVALGGSLAYAHVRASRRAGLALTHHRVPWSIERRVRIVHLTDVHVGPTTPRRHLRRVAEVVRGLGCDVVVMTGDYVNASAYHESRITELIRDLPAPCIAVLGNHDHWTDPVRITRALEAGGARVLRNDSLVVRGAGFALPIVGVDDGRSRNADVARAFSSVPEPHRALVLTHDPKTAEAIAPTGAPLVLAGHTHAGQALPRALSFVTKTIGMPYLRGFHRIGRTDLYVSAGIGHSLYGLRAASTAPEIAIFDLDPDARTRTSLTSRTALTA